MISLENKLFDEVDKPEDSKILSENKEKGKMERESSWTGRITGVSQFPSGTAKGQEISFIGKDVSKNGKFYVLRAFFTDSEELVWINGLVCILDGKHDLQNNSFVCSGYKLM
jgi:hypothetical protein